MISEIKNSIIGKTSSYMIFKIIAYFIALVSVPICTNILAEDLFGEISLIESSVQLIIAFFVLGIPQAYIRFFYEEEKTGHLMELDASYFFLIVLTFCASSVFCFIFFPLKYNLSHSVAVLLGMIAGFGVANQQLFSYIRARGNAYLHSMLLGIEEGLGYIFPVLFISFSKKTTFIYFSGRFISALFISVFTVVIIRKFVYVRKKCFNSGCAKKIICYGAPLLLLSLGVSIFGNADRIVIGEIMGLESVAFYTVPAKAAHVVQQLLLYPINMVLFPYYMKLWSTRGKKATEEFLSEAFDVYTFVAIPLLMGSLVLRNDIVLLLSNREYARYSIIFPILLAALLVYGAYYFIAPGFYLENKTLKLGTTMFFSAACNVVLNFCLGKFYGLIGVCIATGIAYLIFLVLGYVPSRKIICISVNRLKIVRYLLSSVVMYIVLIIILKYLTGSVLRITVSIFVGAILYLLLNHRSVKHMISNLKGRK